MIFYRVCLLSISVAFLSAAQGAFAEANVRGEQVYKLCAFCHGDRGEGRQDLAAPAIAGLPEWYLKRQLNKFYEGARGTHPRDVAGMRMNPMARTLNRDMDLEPVALYVAALPRLAPVSTVKGRVVKGEASFKVCVACHGEHAEGNEAVGGPPLTGASDWYLLTQLRNFKAGVRAGDPAKDPTGAAMRGIATGLTEENMSDVIAYINILKHKQ
ncbi:MAG: c-type cytochrome [Proteobacteria bacterium]|nr:c-type cytochrome [Pseudomonadota bacterium]